MNNPKISIVIPCFNHGKYLREALESIDVSPNIAEVIIVNDGSNDAFTNQILHELEAEGYTVINQPNRGLGKTRNNGIKRAKGQFILPLDADNKLVSGYVHKVVSFLESNPEVSVVYSDNIFFGERSGINKVADFNLQKLMTGNYIDACAVFRRSAWEMVGGYDENMPYMGVEDWELWLNMSFHGVRFYHLPEPGFYYRVINHSMIKKDTSPNFNVLKDYIEQKHRRFLDFNSPVDALSIKFKANPMVLVAKLILLTYFKKTYQKLVKKRKIKRL